VGLVARIKIDVKIDFTLQTFLSLTKHLHICLEINIKFVVAISMKESLEQLHSWKRKLKLNFIFVHRENDIPESILHWKIGDFIFSNKNVRKINACALPKISLSFRVISDKTSATLQKMR